MLNRVVLIGRLTRDPEIRYTSNGTAVTNFTLAVDRGFTNREGKKETDFIDIVTWRKIAETCADYLKKGIMTAVEGRLQISQYEVQTGENKGQKRKVAEVVADNVRFLEWAGGKNEERNEPQSSEDELADDFSTLEDDVPF